MLVNFNAQIKDFDGNPIKDEQEKDMDLRRACVRALMTPLPQDKDITPEKALERFRFATGIQSGTVNEISPEQAVELRGRIAKTFSLVVSGPALSMLNG